MTGFCPRCRQSLSAAAVFCPNCGTGVAAPAPPQAMAPAPPAAGYPAPPAAGYPPPAPVYPSSAAQGPLPSGYGPPATPYAPAPGAYSAQAVPQPYAPQLPRPSATPGAKQMAFGVGAVGCVGVLVAAFFGVAILVVSRLGKSSSGSSGGDSSGQTEPAGGRQQAPSEGSLKDLARTQVGPYKLVSAGHPDLPDSLHDGLTDNLGLIYQGAGAKVDHVLLAYSSAEQAARVCSVMIQVLGEKKSVRKLSLSNQGVHIGDMAVISGGASELVLWNDKNLCLQASAPPTHAFTFAKDVPY